MLSFGLSCVEIGFTGGRQEIGCGGCLQAVIRKFPGIFIGSRVLHGAFHVVNSLAAWVVLMVCHGLHSWLGPDRFHPSDPNRSVTLDSF